MSWKNAWILAIAIVGCAAPRVAAPGPVEVEIASKEDALRPPDPPPAKPPEAEPPIVEVEVPAREAWTTTFEILIPYADAIARARVVRDRALAAPLPRYSGPVTMAKHQAFVAEQGKAWFQAVHPLLDAASSAYARAFRAKDATTPEKLVAMSEAADLHVTLANRLLELGALPMGWRTDPTSAFTYEEVIHGPEQQWKAEGMRLAARCADLARSEHVTDASVGRCDQIRRGRMPRSASGACCPEGDPLCSASLAWCKDE